MNKFLKYLIFIFLGILIYLILNQINLFTIGSPDSPQYDTRHLIAGGRACAASSSQRLINLSVDFFAVHLDNLSTNCSPPYFNKQTLVLDNQYKKNNYVIHQFNTNAIREGKKTQMYGGGDQTITEVGLLYVKHDIFEYDRVNHDNDISRLLTNMNFDQFNQWISDNAIFISFVDRGRYFMSAPYRLDTAEFPFLNNNTLFKIGGHVYKPLDFYKLMKYRKVMGNTPTPKSRYNDIGVLDREFDNWDGYLKSMCGDISIPYYRLVRKDIESLFSDPEMPVKINKNDSNCMFAFMGTEQEDRTEFRMREPDKAYLLDYLSWMPLHILHDTYMCKITDHLNPIDASAYLTGSHILNYDLNIPSGDLYSTYSVDEILVHPSAFSFTFGMAFQDGSIPSPDALHQGPPPDALHPGQGGDSPTQKTSKFKDSKFFITLLNEEIDIYNGITKVEDGEIFYPHDTNDYLVSQNNLKRSGRQTSGWNDRYSVDYTLIDLHGNTFICSAYDDRYLYARLQTDPAILDSASSKLITASLSVPVGDYVEHEFFPTIAPGSTSNLSQMDSLILVTYKTDSVSQTTWNTAQSAVNYRFTLEYPNHSDLPFFTPAIVELESNVRIDLEYYLNLNLPKFILEQPERVTYQTGDVPELSETSGAPPIALWPPTQVSETKRPRDNAFDKILDSLILFVIRNNLHNKNPEEIFLRYLYHIHNRIDYARKMQITELVGAGMPVRFAVIYLHIHNWDTDVALRVFFQDGLSVSPPTELEAVQIDINSKMDEYFDLDKEDQEKVLKLMCMKNISMYAAINIFKEGVISIPDTRLQLSKPCSDYNDNQSLCDEQTHCQYEIVKCRKNLNEICNHVVALIMELNGEGMSITIEEAKNLLIQTNYNIITIPDTKSLLPKPIYEATQYYMAIRTTAPDVGFLLPTTHQINPNIIFDFYSANIAVLESYDSPGLTDSINGGINAAVEITLGPMNNPNDEVEILGRNDQRATLQWNYIEINNEMVDYITQNPNEADQQSRRDEILALKPSILADQTQMDNMAQRSPHMVEAIRAEDPAQFIEMMIDDDYFVQWAQTPGTYMGDTGGTDPVVVRLRILGNTALRQIWETALIEAIPVDDEDTLYTVDVLSIQRVPSNLTVFYFTKPYQYTNSEFRDLFYEITTSVETLKVKWACFKNETIIFEIYLPIGTQLRFDEFGMIYCFAVDTQFIKEYFMRHNIKNFQLKI
jgi:hypothetical protein